MEGGELVGRGRICVTYIKAQHVSLVVLCSKLLRFILPKERTFKTLFGAQLFTLWWVGNDPCHKNMCIVHLS